MTMNYERYKELVPSDTLEFTNRVLQYLDFYEKLRIKSANNKFNCTEDYQKSFFIFLHVLSKTKKYHDLLIMQNYDDKAMVLGDEVFSEYTNFSELFSKYYLYFLIYGSEIDYVNMSPLDLFLEALKEYDNKCYSYDQFYYVFGGDSNFDDFKAELDDFNSRMLDNDEEKLEKKVLKDFSLNVKSFLKVASTIRYDLIEYYEDNEYIQDVEKDSIPLSLLLALRYYDDIEKDEYDITMKNIIHNVLFRAKLYIDSDNNAIGYSERKNDDPNIYTIKYLYKKYYEGGIYDGKPNSEVTVQGIIENVLNQDLNDSLILDRIMKKDLCNPEDLKDFTKLVELEYDRLRKEKEDNYINSLYDDLRNDVKEYLEFSTRVYSLIKEKMKESKHNKDILSKDDDIDTLALFIASFYYNQDVAEFYKYYGITLDKVLKFVGLEITKEEIENTELNRKLLVDIFTRFVKNGVNSSKSTYNVTVSDVNHNLCERKFNKSTIMEDIFCGLTDNIVIGKDFLNQLLEELNEKAKARHLNEYNQLFEDCDIPTTRYLQRIVRIYEEMLKFPNMNGDLKTLAVLFAIKNYEHESNLSLVLYNNGLNLNTLEDKIINNSYVRKAIDDQDDFLYMPDKVNVELLIKDFKNLIFDEKGDKRDLISIIKTIPSFCDPMTMADINSRFNISSEIFTNIEELMKKQEELLAKEKKEKNAKEKFYFDYEGKEIINEAIRILEYLKTTELNNLKDLELVDLSVLLGILSKSYNKQFLEKNGLTLESVCDALEIDFDAMSSFEYKIEYAKHVEEFHKYIRKNKDRSNVTAKQLRERFFKDSPVLDFVIDKLNDKNGETIINPTILKAEVINEKRYEETLPIEERISLLDKQTLEPLDLDQMESVLRFGTGLGVHSKYIYDELPKLSSSDSCDTSVDSIQTLVAKVYDRKEVRRNVFARLFSTNNDRVEINLEALSDVREAIDSNIEILSEELISYDKIRQYLQKYREKIRDYLTKANELVDEISEELSGLDPTRDEDFDRYTYLKGLLQIMKDKVNRFSTTNVIAQQDLLRISQATVNHFITINALEMAKNDLFPLIGGELAISRGRESEKHAMELSKNVIDLFNALLTRNVEGTKENLEMIKRSSIPIEFIEAIHKDVDSYLEKVDELKLIPPTQVRPKNKRSGD